MKNTDFYNLPSSPSYIHLLESEEDFHFGAKTTSFLPPATMSQAAVSPTTTTAFDLPEWMESREILGLPSMFEDLPLPLHTSTPQGGTLLHLKEDDYCSTIKPEDMLVPLSELQPPHTPASPPLASTPPVSPVHVCASPIPVPVSPPPAPATPSPADAPPLPKIIICRKVNTTTMKTKPMQVQYSVMPVKQVPQRTSGTPIVLHMAPQTTRISSKKSCEGQAATLSFGGCFGEPQVNGMGLVVPENATDTQASQPCDAEELIDEMVQMIGSSSALQNLENVAFDSEVMEANMEDLLSQLVASDTDTTTLDLKPFSPSSSASISTSLPAESPLSTSISSPHPSESFPSSPMSLPSPVPSVGSLSPVESSSDSLFLCGVESSAGDYLEEEWSPLEETHSYSRSQRKARTSRRTPATRKAPYPENRKERKKEQNKQAALRYRQKKKQEDDDLMGKMQVEEERQKQLKSTYTGLKQELSYLKKIMREVFIARGILSEEALRKAALETRRCSK